MPKRKTSANTTIENTETKAKKTQNIATPLDRPVGGPDDGGLGAEDTEEKTEITKKKSSLKSVAAKKPIAKSEVLIGTGRRKTAVARVWLKKEKGPFIVNDKPIEEYFSREAAKKTYEEPLRVVNRLGQFSGTIKLAGGGPSAQLGALVHGLTRALASYEPSFREILAKKKLLTRDSRMKERRKYGHAGKARKKKQSPKR